MTVIRNGTVVDGSGRPGFVGDLVIDGERIVDVVPGGLPKPPVAESLDAAGMLVTPGFIDAHAHSDAYLVLEPQAPSKLAQGITTEINGQCGGSAAPRYGEARLSSDWASLLGERLTWRSMAQYREALETAHPAINTVQFVGHNTLRSSVVGYAGRTATADEQRRMERLLAESLDEGGWGLTTGLVYQPGKYSTREEVVALAKVAANKGGFYATHMRSEGDRLLEAIDEVLEVVDQTGIRAEISHFKTSGKRNWHKLDAALGKLQAAVDGGKILGADRYPFCAAGTDLDVVLSDWAGEGGAPYEMQRLADPALRAKIVAELNADGRDWSSVMVGGTWSDATRRFGGRTISSLLEAGEAESPGELVCRILEADACRTGGFFFGMSEENLDRILARDWIVPGSDASLRAPWGPLGADHPHPRAYSTMPEFYRRVRALGISREQAIARMTSVPANRFGIRSRGILAKGAYADVAVWQEERFAGRATYDRPHRFAEGVRAVFVNGTLAYGDGKFAAVRSGRFLSRNG